MPSFGSTLAALVAAVSLAPTVAATCYSYGIDFQNGGSYFINAESTDNFTAVTQFEGCEEDTATVWIIGPDESQGPIYCSDIALTPDDANQMTTCGIQKDQMYSGEWLLTIRSNNGNSTPFESQKSFYLTVGDQTTTTVTNTVTWSITSTPTSTINATSEVLIIDTLNNTSTVTSPAETATKTITPKAVKAYTTSTITKTRKTWAEDLTTITKTQTLSCTVPPKAADPDPSPFWTPSAQYAALYAGVTGDVAKLRARGPDPPMEDKVRRMLPSREPLRHHLEERAPDSQTITVTADTVVNTTTTYTADATTTTEVVFATSTVESTLPPSTVYTGTTTSTITAATPTKTYPVKSYTTVYTTKTLYETWTYTTVVTPTASVSACKHAGGHFKPRPKW